MVRALATQGILPRTIVDVGANKGQFTVAAVNLLHPARVHSFEPLPREAAALRRHCARYPQVTVHEVALGDASSRARLHVNAHSHSSSLLELGERHRRAFPSAAEVDVIDVEVSRLDETLDPASLESPVLVKIDTQGYEAKVLAGAEGLLNALDWLIIETSFEPLYEGEQTFGGVVERVAELGYRFVRPVGSLCDPATGEFLQMDVLFERT